VTGGRTVTGRTVTEGRATAGGSHADRVEPGLAPDVCLLAVALVAGLGSGRLTETPTAAHVVGPIVATVVTGHLATSAARRLRLQDPTSALCGVVAVVLAATWGSVPGATLAGIPTPTTWHALVSTFRAAGDAIRSHPTPLPATTGVVLCLALGAGLTAVFARSIWAWQETPRPRPLLALIPSFGLFCYTALLSSQVDRLPAALSYLVSALVFVVVGDRSHRIALRTGTRHGFAGARSVRSVRSVRAVILGAVPAVLGVTLAIGVPLAASPALGALKLNALPFSSSSTTHGLGLGPNGGSGGSGGGNGLGFGGESSGVRAIDLVDNLQAVLIDRTTEVMFNARSPQPTYWQVAVLTRFDGTAWLPDPFTQAAALSEGVPLPVKSVPYLPALAEPTNSGTFRVTVTIKGLQSTLLPLPPTTASVDPGAGASYVEGFGAVRGFEAPPSLSYSAVARIPGNITAGRSSRSSASPESEDGASTVPAAALQPYLDLPPEPDAVVQLAHRLVSGATSPAAKAAAIARWFNSGRYHYTLSPPALTGPDPLSSFLFTTRAGFCQQFAAAYAVLARIDGLPARVALGFTTGTIAGDDEYSVTGADAHVWPEVYLGPTLGWTSFEPTPATTGEPSGVGVNTGAHGPTPKPVTPSLQTTPTTLPDLHHLVAPHVTTPTPAIRGHGSAASGVSSATGSWTAVLLPIVGAVLVVGTAMFVGVRRRRWTATRIPQWLGRVPGLSRAARWARTRLRRGATRRLRRGDPTEDVLARWHDAGEMLARARLGKRPAETIDEHAARLRALAGSKWLASTGPVASASRGASEPPIGVEDAIAAYGELAALAARASYGAAGCTTDEADAAERLGDVVRAGLGRSRGRAPVSV
jgi:transglutaminase-like putative cysteine protease